MDNLSTKERADAFLACKRRCNIPHPREPGKRIVGWVVDEDVAGLGLGLLALDEIERRAAVSSSQDGGENP